MRGMSRTVLIIACIFAFMCAVAFNPSPSLAAKTREKAKAAKAESEDNLAGKVNDSFDVGKMSDMSDFDPSNPIVPTGDTIKIGIIEPFSGLTSFIGEAWYLCIQWVAHDYNKRGGIWVDGKKKMVEVIKGDTMAKLDQVKKVCERMALREKVHVMVGSEGTPAMKIIQETANKYKIIANNFEAYSDDLMDALNFNRYSFQSTYDTTQIGRSIAYYYGQVRKKEKRFYILCQDYGYGHLLAEGFKKGLKDYYPEAQIVGEDYHKLFLMDFAPYLTKIKAADAEVVFTGDWIPDLSNLIKQARQYGIKIPFAGKDMDNPNMASDLGMAGSIGLVSISDYDTTNPMFKTAKEKKYHKIWNDLWKTKWKTPPYNTNAFRYAEPFLTGRTVSHAYWLFSVIERAKSTDPEKIINVWENDRYRTLNGKVLTMRACDHKLIQDMAVIELVPPAQQKISYNIPPYYWYEDFGYTGPVSVIPAVKVLPFMDQNLDRCKGKNGWGR